MLIILKRLRIINMRYNIIIFYRFSGIVGALGSLGAGYNGLPSVMSGLDDSLSDVAPRKKYPFELEKAIHNVMFIQHHMQRQDEFNAVSNDNCINFCEWYTEPNKRVYEKYQMYKIMLLNEWTGVKERDYVKKIFKDCSERKTKRLKAEFMVTASGQPSKWALTTS